jgi:hypothetical protein
MIFVKLNADNIVIDSVVVNDSVILDNGIPSELIGIQYLNNITKHSKWKSSNTNIPSKTASIGDIYYPDQDVFKSPQPYSSWIFDEIEWRWRAPVSYPIPNDNEFYVWNESIKNWELS